MRNFKRFVNKYIGIERQYSHKLRGLLGFTPANVAVYKLAFTHSSKSAKAHESNERLEFLGDAVLDTVVSEFLFMRYPLKGEGFLTEMRAKIVNRKRLGEIGGKLMLQDFLVYDKNYVNVNPTILGNAVEALIGAIYIDAGYERCRNYIYNEILRPYINFKELHLSDINFKSRLFEWAQKHNKDLEFVILQERGTNDRRMFSVGAVVDGKQMGTGEGRSKKIAQKQAAKMVYEKMKVGEDLANEQ